MGAAVCLPCSARLTALALKRLRQFGQHDNNPHNDTERSDIMIKKILFMTVAALLVSPSLMAVPVGTSKAEMKLYKAYISANGDCSSPTVFYNAEEDMDNRVQDASGNYYIVYDLDVGAIIAEAAIAEGTYNCVIIKVTDYLTFSPDAVEAEPCESDNTPEDLVCICDPAEDYTIDVCWDTDDSGAGAPVYDPENGTTGNCTAGIGTEDVVWIYISTYSTGTSGAEVSSFTPPTASGDPLNGHSLATGTINFTTDMTGTFIFGTDDKVHTATIPLSQGGGTRCEMLPCDFGFTAE